MSIVKAKCLKCNEVIEVENTEDAGICPSCGSAYVTEKVIKNYNDGTVAQNPVKSRTYLALADLAEKYNAFVALYKVDNSSLLEVFRFRERIRDKEALVNKYVDDYNSAVKDEQRMVNRYNRRVDGFNDAKYTAGADSLSEKLHRKYVESALNKKSLVESDIKYSKKKVQEGNEELLRLVDEEKALAQKIFKENLHYNFMAKAVAEKMCNDYPSNPLGYLYLADWYKRESKWKKKFYEYARQIYEEDSVVITEFNREFNNENSDKCAQAELEKANTFMTDGFYPEYGDLVEKLKGAKKPRKSSAQSSARTSSNNAKTPNSTAARSTTAKPKSSAKPKSTASTTPKFKSGSEKDRKKKIERKARAQVRAWNLFFKLLLLGIVGAVAVCVCKFVFHLF